MNQRTFFEFCVERNPDRVAVIDRNKQLTYVELNEKVNRVASALQKLGLRKQERVMVLLKNRIETVVLYWAVQKLGAIFTPVNFRLSLENIKYCIHDVEPKIVIFEESSEHLITKETFIERPIFIGISNKSELSDVGYNELVNYGSISYREESITDQDISILYYTSGTTGVPKGVPRSHNNEYSATTAHVIQFGTQPFDKTLGAAPLYHVIGLRSLQAMTALNGVFVVLADFDSFESLQMIDQEKISCLFLTPTMYHDLVFHPTAKEVDFPHLHTIVYSGSPMSKELIKKCDEVLRPKWFINLYGSTEIYTFAYCRDVREKPGSAGKPGFHQNIRLIPVASDKEAPVKGVVSQGEVGEIVVNMESPEAFKGYWNRPDLTRDHIFDGWYFTGDLGVVDQDGDLTIVGRADDMIISGGENIYPELIEKVLMEHPQVNEVAIIGELDERMGQIVVAYIVSKDQTLTFHELDRYCKYNHEIPSYKRPRKYEFVETIPRSSGGKILRNTLRKGHLINDK
ncbi:class I adenylate-forming enzyme family protein [Metabacillus herbersteinensis]|uniref:Class I adenylate-forming enzyme family protein n=1 Tax=Metabacillus herbersteinensis TaxID=283816 RepID=A0ABV6GHU7_9BACI